MSIRTDHTKQWYSEHPGVLEEIKRERRENFVATYVNGKPQLVPAPNKRPRPEACELCKKRGRRLAYHHWDGWNVSKGLWLCPPCHLFAEFVDRGLVPDYMEIKTQVEEEFSKLLRG